MKTNRLTVQIIKPTSEVFAFTLNPKNTPKWVDSIIIEETNEWPPKIGTIYRNRGASDAWDEYEITEFKENEMFTMSKRNGNYYVKYTFKALADYKTEMEYFEWVDEGELEGPFKQEALNKLKKLVEGV